MIVEYLKNLIYFWLGLLIMAGAKIKNKIGGYRRPRVIPTKDAQKNIDYDIKVISDLEERLHKILGYKYDFIAKDILEIGPGPDLGAGIIFLAKGAASYTGIDKFRLLKKNNGFYEKLLLRIGKGDQPSFRKLVQAINSSIEKNDAGINYDNFKHINLPFEMINNKFEKKFDLIFSNAVLEHIKNIKVAFKVMYQALKDNGIIFQVIDLQTHSRFIRQRDPLNILRYDECVYKIFKFDGSPNRLRINDYLTIAEQAGFKNIKIVAIECLSEKNVATVRRQLASPYKNYDFEKLKYLSAAIYAEK